MKHIKRLLSMAFLLAAILGCLVFHASAAEVVASGYCGGKGDGSNLRWTLSSDGTLSISGTGIMQDWNDIVCAPWCASKYRDTVKKVIIDDGVSTIGQCAFEHCDNLVSATIPDSVHYINQYAFNSCDSLASVDIGNNVTTIGKYAFQGCTSLTAVTIPVSVSTIREYAFSNCDSLTSVTIPNSVTAIDDYVFLSCDKLTSVTISNSVITIGSNAFADCTSLKDIAIPNSVITIGASAFNGCTSLSAITIPNSVTSIGNFAFADCIGLTSMVIPNSVCEISQMMFYNCTSLAVVTIPNSVTSIGPDAFYNCCKLTSVIIPDSVTSIQSNAFEKCGSLTAVYFEGCAPTMRASNDRHSSFDADLVTLYYNPIAIGWSTPTRYGYASYPCPHADVDEDEVCIKCGATNAHYYEAVVTTPTCTEDGYTTYTCTRCGDVYVGSETEALGHIPGPVTTCTTAQICTVCKKELAIALGHDNSYCWIGTNQNGTFCSVCSRCKVKEKDFLTYTVKDNILAFGGEGVPLGLRIMVASYDDDDRFLGINLYPISTPTSIKGAAYLRVFVLDDTYAPVSDNLLLRRN